MGWTKLAFEFSCFSVMVFDGCLVVVFYVFGLLRVRVRAGLRKMWGVDLARLGGSRLGGCSVRIYGEFRFKKNSFIFKWS